MDCHGGITGGDNKPARMNLGPMFDPFTNEEAFILNHVLREVLNHKQAHENATNAFTTFIIANGINNAQILIAMNQDNFNLMGWDIGMQAIGIAEAINLSNSVLIFFQRTPTKERFEFV